MKFRIRPGKATCAGLVAVMLVMPSSIWKRTSSVTKMRIVVTHEAKSPKKIR